MKKVFKALLISLAFPSLVSAAFNDVQLTTGTTLQVTVGGTTLDLTVTSGNVETLRVDGGSLSVDLAANSSIDLTSADRRSFTFAPTGISHNFECGSSSSTLNLSRGQGEATVTVTVTPTSTTCVNQAAGGGGSGSPEPPPAVVAPTPKPEPVPAPQLAAIVEAVQLPQPEAAQPSPVAQLVSPVFNRNLQIGNRGDEVRRLQELLAQDKELYPEGLVTGYYGSLTREAVRRFQLKYGVISSPSDQGNGRLGPRTRAKMREVYGEGVPAPSSGAPAAPPAAVQSLQEQIQALLKKVQELQEQIKAKQGQ
jgi:hypothetical protein